MESNQPLTPGVLPPMSASHIDRLRDKSVYDYVAEVRWGTSGQFADVGLKAAGVDVAFSDGLVVHYDLEGRLTRVATPNIQWRRGLSHRTVWLRKRSHAEGGGLESRVLDRDMSDQIADEISSRVRAVLHAHRQSADGALNDCDATPPARAELDALLSRAAAFDAQGARADYARFRSVYGEVPILPPDQYGALVLLATDGCVYNQCTFCGFYRDRTFRLRTATEFRIHVSEALAYHGAGLAARRGVFLGQANALTGPRAWREEILRAVNEQCSFPTDDSPGPRRRGSPPRVSGISSFIDAFTGQRISPEEYQTLRGLQLRRVYFGVETGDAELLAWLQKPATPQDMLEAITAAKCGGLQVGVMLLVGVGGEPFFESHLRETVQLLKALPLGQGDYIYLSPLTAAPQTEYAQRAAANGIAPLSAERMSEQMQHLRYALHGMPRRQRPYVAHYEVAHFVY